jgi:uncharacterized protein YegP (UPF0339 family)
MAAHWEAEEVKGGFRLTLVGDNGEEVMRAMTLYDDHRDARHAVDLARSAGAPWDVEPHDKP